VVALAPQPGWRFCYRTPEGGLVIAPPPAEVTGHFGANLVRYLLGQHYMCHAELPLVVSKKRYRT